ncbi:MAG: DUF1540 domain-containing protein [Clostridium sp.]|uniref:DUF1540 domain-containing protein n=1 Tax=Anaeromassilibacillus senegalensis TaxID=1673717 RepID=A0ABS9MIG2_9FIRM|nr:MULTISPECIES: DUF1540 domain-containing protein [Anaeromassilibacillus]MBS5621525.1 DUF1540 domain-containing protein [Clostridium sp.]MCG4610607.1 DUF1540 domain-containing protein [Anaeromassilibacillus senegalensis]OUO72833.1 hypothetical protein B5F54_13585 [Anaeromassilibacillus sp. An250]HJB49619.1 DUF1540 domain-containing protein [Candidatus Anaeromassilibacillus stercoravium]
MTNLRCTVTSCANNSQDCCCRPDIKVAGACACGCEQTCCSDFTGKSGSASNVSSCGCSNPNPSLHVRCEARNCIYNENNECIAENIHVADGSCGKADCKSQTECATFKMR